MYAVDLLLKVGILEGRKNCDDDSDVNKLLVINPLVFSQIWKVGNHPIFLEI